MIGLHGDRTGPFYELICCKTIYLGRRVRSLNLSSRKRLQVSMFISDRPNLLAPSHMFVETPWILVCLAITTFPVKLLNFKLHRFLHICWTTCHCQWYSSSYRDAWPSTHDYQRRLIHSFTNLFLFYGSWIYSILQMSKRSPRTETISVSATLVFVKYIIALDWSPSSQSANQTF
jgi:hypothetical protein